MNNMTKFKFGYHYIDAKLHEYKVSEGKLAILVLIPTNKESEYFSGKYFLPKFTVSGSNYNKQGCRNILSSDFNSNTFYMNDKRELFVEKGKELFKLYFIPFEQQKPFPDEQVLKLARERKQIVVTKEYIKKSARKTSSEDAFMCIIPMNSYNYAKTGFVVMGRPHGYLAHGLLNDVKTYENRETINNSFNQKYYPKVIDVVTDPQFQHLSYITKNQHTRFLAKLSQISPVIFLKRSDGKEEMSNYMKERLKQDKIAKKLTQKESSLEDWVEIFTTNLLPNVQRKIQDVSKIKQSRNPKNYSAIYYSDKLFGEETTLEMIELALQYLRRVLKNKGLNVTTDEIALSTYGYSYVNNAISTYLESIKG